jgi:ubiquinone/menaquinone biosynthesis C-methylase UbiE
MSTPITPPQPGPMQQPATWSATAEGYAEEIVQHAGLYAEKALSMLGPRPNDQLLDIATGPGTLAFLAAPRVARVVATDFAPGMIEQLVARAAREGVANVEGLVMDAQTLAFADASFDAVFCMFGFMFFPDRARVFHEMRRVLRPGSRALMATWGPIERRPLMKIGFDAMAEALPQFPPPTKGDLQSREDCVREMSDAGFGEVTAELFTATAHADSAEHYLRIMARSGAPLVALKKKLGDAAWAETEKRLLAAIRRQVPEGGIDLPAEAILTVGRA